MKAFRYLFLSLFFSLVSCADKEEVNPGIEETFWVYSFLIPNISKTSIPSQGLIITYSEEFNFDWSTWEFIPSEIEGFVFKPTYFQKLLVSRIDDPKTGVIRRKLIRILDEEKDFFQGLEGSWKVRKFLGRDLPNDDFPEGQSVGIFGFPRVAVSSNGCNQVTLKIKKIAQNKILSVELMPITLLLCPWEHPKIAPFPGLSYNFKREENTLTIYSDTEGEIAVWEKVN